MKNLLLVSLFIFNSLTSYGKDDSIESIKTIIHQTGNSDNHEASIRLLCDFLAAPNVSHTDRYEAYMLKAGIYRKLYKYEHALHYLDLALQEGLKCSDRLTMQQEVKAERSFIYFDKQEFDKSEDLTNELEETGYRYLDNKYRLFLYTQKGYFLLQKKEYEAAEKILNKAAEICKLHFTEDLPIVYGKLIELYHLTRQFEKRDQTYISGVQSARSSSNIKYEFYLEEIMKNVFSKSKDYKNAFYHQQKCDSLFAVYNSNIKSSRIELLEQRLKDQDYDYGLKKKYYFLLTITVFSFLLLLLLFITFKLYKNTKIKNKFITEENQRVREEIKYHTKLAEQKQQSYKNKIKDYNFTERQLQIIDLVKRGKSNKEIASELFISDNTVKYHLKTIYSILNIKQRNELLILYSSEQ